MKAPRTPPASGLGDLETLLDAVRASGVEVRVLRRPPNDGAEPGRAGRDLPHRPGGPDQRRPLCAPAPEPRSRSTSPTARRSSSHGRRCAPRRARRPRQRHRRDAGTSRARRRPAQGGPKPGWPRLARPRRAAGGREGEGSDEAIRVLLADDQALVRRGLRTILETEPDIEIVGEAAGRCQAVALARRRGGGRRPDGRPDAAHGRPGGHPAARPSRHRGADRRARGHDLRSRRGSLRRAARRRRGFLLEVGRAGRAGRCRTDGGQWTGLISPEVTRRLITRIRRKRRTDSG